MAQNVDAREDISTKHPARLNRCPPVRQQLVNLTRTLRRHPGQCRLGTGAHVHRLGGEPDGVDANHRRRSRRKVAQAAAFSVGQLTFTVPRVCCISTQIFGDAGWGFAPAGGMANGINAGGSVGLFCACSRIHLWTRFALRLWLSATLAIEAPGWEHS